MPLLDDTWICGECLFYQVSPDEVWFYRHRGGYLVKARVVDGVCDISSDLVPLPLYIGNQLRIMLNLEEDAQTKEDN